MQNILVTGGGGYIGTHVVKELLKQGYSVLVLDNFSRGYRKPLELLAKYGKLKVIEGDVRKVEDVKAAFSEKVDAVMHLAALCNINESVEKPELYIENNVQGTENLLTAMKEAGVEKIIFSSTCAVYGEAKYLPTNELHPISPLNPYGESKRESEKRIENMAGDVNYVIFRYFNVTGADAEGEIGDSKTPSELLVQNAVRGALDIEKFYITSAPVDTPDKTAIRDYVDVLDIARAHIAALDYLNKGGESAIINLGTGKGYSVKEVLEEVKNVTHKTFEINSSEKPRMGESSKVYADFSKALKVLGWHPARGLKDSIASLVKWYINNPQGYN